jgi:hypothetical protein
VFVEFLGTDDDQDEPFPNSFPHPTTRKRVWRFSFSFDVASRCSRVCFVDCEPTFFPFAGNKVRLAGAGAATCARSPARCRRNPAGMPPSPDGLLNLLSLLLVLCTSQHMPLSQSTMSKRSISFDSRYATLMLWHSEFLTRFQQWLFCLVIAGFTSWLLELVRATEAGGFAVRPTPRVGTTFYPCRFILNRAPLTVFVNRRLEARTGKANPSVPRLPLGMPGPISVASIQSCLPVTSPEAYVFLSSSSRVSKPILISGPMSCSLPSGI